jgi:hypothetical protein
MSYADGQRVIALETTVAALLARVAVLEEMVAVLPAQRPQSAPADDAVMADVVEALEAGQSIRGAANMLGLDRNKVARLRQRAIAEGCLTCLAPIETSRGAP